MILRALILTCVFLMLNGLAAVDIDPKLEPPPIRTNEESGFIFAFAVYENIISPIDGDRCNMLPSCSAYSKDSLAKHSLIKGILMTADRLMRCGMDTRLYPTISIGERDFHHDPVD
jgi:uncharacterized protein